MNYVLIAYDHSDDEAFNRRNACRAEHIANVTHLEEEGKIIYAMAMLDGDKIVGSIVSFEVESEDEVTAYVAKDPYTHNQVWDPKRIEIKACLIPEMFKPTRNPKWIASSTKAYKAY